MTTLVAFETARAMVGAAGLTPGQCHYSPEAFGSWFVETEVKPKRRLVWDGRESQLVVETESAPGNWTEIWLRSSPSESDVSEGIALLCKASS